jgi:3-deoxy-D-manno-octulosonic-acid transferase
LYLIYRFAIAPIALFLLILAGLFNAKVREVIRLRRHAIVWPKWLDQHPVLWVHAASGEFEYAKPLIREWRLRHPSWKIFVTYFSPTFRSSIEQDPLVDASAPLPFDLPGPVLSFLKRLNPRCLAISRTDLWPELLHQTQRLKIPTILFSTTRKPVTPLVKITAPLLKWRYKSLDLVLAVSEADSENLKRGIGIRAPVTVIGDTRYDQVRYRLRHPKPIRINDQPFSRAILIAGSTWPKDETALLAAAHNLVKDGRLSLIVAPHEPTKPHLTSLEDKIKSHGLSSVRYSGLTQWPLEEVLIIDQVGILAEIYALGDMALVGGSFSGSVHSVMEPLAAGLLTFVGPTHLNNREAVDFQRLPISNTLSFVTAVSGEKDLAARLKAALETVDFEKLGPTIKAEVNARTGASAKVCQQIEFLIKEPPSSIA